MPILIRNILITIIVYWLFSFLRDFFYITKEDKKENRAAKIWAAKQQKNIVSTDIENWEEAEKQLKEESMKFIRLCIIIGIFVIGAFVLIYGGTMIIKINNNIVTAYQNTEKSLADLETEYQCRYALIDNFVSIIKEIKEFELYAMEFEKEIYIQTAEQKANATKLNLSIPEQIKEKNKKEDKLTTVISALLEKVLVMAQHYPQINDPQIKDRIHTIEALNSLKQDLKQIEKNVLYSRQQFNNNVNDYNIQISLFPANIIAKNINYKKIDYFETVDEEAEKDVKIKF